MSFAVDPWTTGELRVLVAMRAEGASLQEIADALPKRSRKAVGNFISRAGMTGKPKQHRSPPAPKPPEEIAQSQALFEATTAAIARFANDNRMTEQEAATILLGREPQGVVARIRPCATSRTGHSPFEITARPIGEIIKPIVERARLGMAVDG